MKLQFLVALAALVAIPAPKESEVARKEKKHLEGAWVAATPDETGKKIKFAFTAERLTITWEQELSFSYTLDSSKDPKEIDYTALDGPLKGRTVRAIYALDGDSLKLCSNYRGGKERPTKFVTDLVRGIQLRELKREKP